MNKKETKNWSVILLMAIGVLFVTIAGCIFVSNTWKILSYEAKEILLAAVTIGIFIGSFILRHKDGFEITGKALYYLGVAATGFTSYMILGSFINDQYSDKNITCLKLTVAAAFMLSELVYIYFSNRNYADIILSYVLFSAGTITLSVYLKLSFSAVLITFSVEAILLSLIFFVLNGNSNARTYSKYIALTLYAITTFGVVKFALISLITGMFEDDGFGYISLIAVFITLSGILVFAADQAVYTRIICTLIALFALPALYTDIVVNLDPVPEYFKVEFLTIFIIMFIVMTNIIWYYKNRKSDFLSIITYVVACILGLILLAHNVQTEELACVLTLGIISVLVLFWSTYTVNRKYQILSGVILGLMAIYLTRSFWLSIAWWVYLLVVGIICIVVAIVKEKNLFIEKKYEENFVATVTDISISSNTASVEMDKISEDKPADDLDFLSNK